MYVVKKNKMKRDPNEKFNLKREFACMSKNLSAFFFSK